MFSPRGFSIVTPSFRQSRWLRHCVASVADQQGVGVEHIVQDGGSDDGTLDWLAKDPRVKAFVEPDQGMYDAVNRGFRRASGSYFAYLNCDEQYLPGALSGVAAYFSLHPEVDVVFAGALVVDPDGQLICARRPLIPRRAHILVDHLPVFTCSTFIRRTAFLIDRELFDPRYRAVADAVWVAKLLASGAHLGTLDLFTTVFTDTGENLSLKARAERDELFAAAPAWARRCRTLLVLQHRLRKLLHGHYRRRAVEYAIYVRDDLTQRRHFRIPHAGGVWRSRL